MEHIFPESRMAHKWLDGLSGLEIGPSAHNPFGLDVKYVGLMDRVYQDEQRSLTGNVAELDIVADAEAIPIPSESEEFILASHVVEHCPNMLRAVLEWYRILKPGGILYMITPHRDAAPSDRGRSLTGWDHLLSDYSVNMTSDGEPDVGTFLHCHYHVFDMVSMKGHFQAIFDDRMQLLDQQVVDDKIGNGFVLVYQKTVPLVQAFPWVLEGQQQRVYVPRPADFYTLKEVHPVGLSRNQDLALRNVADQEMPGQAVLSSEKRWHNRPLVSAIMTVYKAERFMKGALEDLVEQTIADQVEIIIVDTDSPEGEGNIVREFQERNSKIVYLRTGFRESPPQAFNYGLRFARGKYVTVANADDRHRSDAFEVMVRELETNPEVALVYGDVWVTRFENQVFGSHVRTGYHIRPEFSKEIMLSGCHMGPQPMWRKTLHEELGEFDGELDSAADYEFWCRIAVRHSMKHIPQFLGLYYDNPYGVVNSNHQKSLKQTLAVQRTYAGKFPHSGQSCMNNYQYSGPVQAGKVVNIGMVTYNRLDFTKTAIASLVKFTCFPHVLTVVDNGSSDGTPEYLKGLKKEGVITHLILLDQNVGVAKASNLAWAQVPDAEYYLKVDNDIVVEKPGWLTKMVEAIERIPELGAVAYNFEPMSYPVQMIKGLPIRPKNGNLGGACILIPKRTHDLLGFWCEDYGFYGEEDADYGVRMKQAGLHNAYMEDEQIGFHLPAGRAAHIDEQTLQAADGIEEEVYAEYRAFKDECRRINVREVTQQHFHDYETGVRPLYCASSFVQEFRHGTHPCNRSELSHPVTLQTVKEKTVSESRPEQDSASAVGAQVSVILSDSICGTIRLVQPLLSGRSLWKIGQVVSDGELPLGRTRLPEGMGHVWVFQRTSLVTREELQEARVTGTRLVHDCDDLLWGIPPDNPNHHVMTPEKIRQMFQFMELVDCVTVSTEPIQADLKKRGFSAQILPNCLVRQEWEGLRPRRRAGSRPRVGWAGQANVHKGDMAILDTIVEALKDEVEWVFLGEAPRAILNAGVISETFSMVELSQYPRKLASLNLDVALAPLAPNEFNEAKSDIRILHYGILGYPVIGTDIFPHRHAPIVRLPHEPQAWIKAIRERIDDLDSSERDGDNLRQWVLDHRLMEHVLPQYEEAWLGQGAVQCPGETFSNVQGGSRPAYSTRAKLKPHFDCSIIVPVWNKVELTQQCLTHLAEVTEGCSYEVIIVDNASTDGTKEFLRTLGGDIHVISNPENYGFAKACNQGAAAAKGRYLVFLNNDTIPKAGWLRALVKEVVQYPDVAIVGGKLLYPDETIQHAGVVFSKNCLTPYHLFQGAPSDLPAVNARREFQAVTAACMLIRREDFEAVGGFEEVYRNGFEDVDLCLKVGKQGKKIIYQPESVLYHLEHQTPGRKDPDAERNNGKVLMERWASSIVVDEDLYTVPEGYANRYYFRDGWLRQLLEPFKGVEERAQWEQVRRVQELLLRRHKQNGRLTDQERSTLETLLKNPADWPLDGEVLRWGAVVCRSLNLPEEEAHFYERVLSLTEDDAARERLANRRLFQGNLEGAASHIQAILAGNPDHPSGNFLQGILHMQEQAFSEAVPCFQKALAGGSDPTKTQKGLGMAYAGVGNFELAWKTFCRLREDQPDDSEVMQLLLQTGTALGCWEQLAETLSLYLERNPADCDMRYALAGAYLRAGQVLQAQQHCSVLATLKPDYEGLEDLQSKLDPFRHRVYALAK